jgi:hypothetical protein
MWTGQRSAQASLEILTPLGDPVKLVWMTPAALSRQLDAWEANGVSGARLAVVLDRIAAAMRVAGQQVAAEDREALEMLADHERAEAEK